MYLFIYYNFLLPIISAISFHLSSKILVLTCPEKDVSCIPSCGADGSSMDNATSQLQCASELELSMECKTNRYFFTSQSCNFLQMDMTYDVEIVKFGFAAYCHEDNFCNYWTYEENLNTGEHNCSLLATCEKKVVASVPVRTSSGGRDCLPEPNKRRKCLK